MSNKPAHCPKCHLDGVCDSVAPFEPEKEHAFIVYWKCPRCQERSLVVSPLGPWLAPSEAGCLQCGHDGVAAGQACPSCGIRIEEVLGPAEAAQPDEDLLRAARAEFARGTCRRGLTLVNHVLRRNPRSDEAWSIKGQFFEYLGYRRALKAAMQEAVRLKSAAGDGPGQAGGGPDQSGGKRWWEFWK
jgi:hypothetical protein